MNALKNHRHITSLCLLVLFPSTSAMAEPNAVSLSDIVVMANRSEKIGGTMQGHHQIISREELRTSGAQTVAEVLKRVAGIQVTDQFGDGSRATISMRGFGENAGSNSLLLIDGRRLNNALDIAPPTLTTLRIIDIERIEIFQGSAGVLYGEGAVGGAINIVTRRSAGNRVELEMGQGSYDRESYTGRISASPLEHVSIRLTGSEQRSDNYRQNNRADVSQYSGRVEFFDERATFFVEGGRFEEDLRLPGALFASQRSIDPRQPNNFADFNQTESDYLKAGWRQQLGQIWNGEFDFSWRDDDLTGNLNFFGTNYPLTQQRRQWSYNPRLTARYPGAYGDALLTIGLDRELAEYELVSGLGTQTGQQTATGAYVQFSIPVSTSLEISAGLRETEVDNDLISGATRFRFDETERVNHFGLIYEPGDRVQTYLRRAESFRFGKIDEHLFFGASQPLESQTGTSWETGVNWSGESTDVGLNLFQLDLEDEIAYDPALFSNRNLDPTRRIGATVRVDQEIHERVQLRAEHAWLNAEFRNGPNQGKSIPFVARNKTTLSANWQPHEQFSGDLRYQHLGSRKPTGDDGGDYARIASSDTVDLIANWSRKTLALSASVNNIFDEDYDSFGTIGFNPANGFAPETAYMPAPGRNFMLTLRYQLGR